MRPDYRYLRERVGNYRGGAQHNGRLPLSLRPWRSGRHALRLILGLAARSAPLGTDLLDVVPPQIPAARGVAEMRQQGVDAGHHDRRADRILDLIELIHRGVQTADLDLFDGPPLVARPQVVGHRLIRSRPPAPPRQGIPAARFSGWSATCEALFSTIAKKAGRSARSLQFNPSPPICNRVVTVERLL